MRNQIGFTMVSEDIGDFVTAEGYGVLSLANENRSYGVPVSYGYDVDSERFILELINKEGSKKQEFIDASEEVTLTIERYQDSDTWGSVIATGTLHLLDQDEVSDRLAALFFSQAKDVAKSLRWNDFEGFQRKWYELRVTDISGRHGGTLPGKQ